MKMLSTLGGTWFSIFLISRCLNREAALRSRRAQANLEWARWIRRLETSPWFNSLIWTDYCETVHLLNSFGSVNLVSLVPIYLVNYPPVGPISGKRIFEALKVAAFRSCLTSHRCWVIHHPRTWRLAGRLYHPTHSVWSPVEMLYSPPGVFEMPSELSSIYQTS